MGGQSKPCPRGGGRRCEIDRGVGGNGGCVGGAPAGVIDTPAMDVIDTPEAGYRMKARSPNSRRRPVRTAADASVRARSGREPSGGEVVVEKTGGPRLGRSDEIIGSWYSSVPVSAVVEALIGDPSTTILEVRRRCGWRDATRGPREKGPSCSDERLSSPTSMPSESETPSAIALTSRPFKAALLMRARRPRRLAGRRQRRAAPTLRVPQSAPLERGGAGVRSSRPQMPWSSPAAAHGVLTGH